MSGHSKWSTIKRKKGAADVKRGKLFTKLIREIQVAARMGGGDPSGNPRLRDALAEAKDNNMTKETIERAVKRGTGELGGESYKEVTYEGYGPGGVAVLVDGLTDNPTRTVADLRFIFSRNGGNLGDSGSVGWIFDRRGVIVIAKEGATEEQLMDKALELGAEDVKTEDGGADGSHFEVHTATLELDKVKAGLEKAGFKILSGERAAVPKNTIRLEGEQAKRMLELMEALDDHDDVQHVFANFDIDFNKLGVSA